MRIDWLATFIPKVISTFLTYLINCNLFRLRKENRERLKIIKFDTYSSYKMFNVDNLIINKSHYLFLIEFGENGHFFVDSHLYKLCRSHLNNSNNLQEILTFRKEYKKQKQLRIPYK